MNLMRCKEKRHYYDGDLYNRCPYCEGKGAAPEEYAEFGVHNISEMQIDNDTDEGYFPTEYVDRTEILTQNMESGLKTEKNGDNFTEHDISIDVSESVQDNSLYIRTEMVIEEK